jgi:leucyl aminopeptidase
MIKLSAGVAGSLPSHSNAVLFCFENNKIPIGSFLFGTSSTRAFSDALSDGFKGKAHEIAVVRSKDEEAARYIFVGLGAEKKATLDNVRKSSAAFIRRLSNLPISRLIVCPPQMGSAAFVAQAITEGILLGSYRFTKFKSEGGAGTRIESVLLAAKNQTELKQLKEGIRLGEIYSASTNLVRDLVNTPPSDMDPEAMVRAAQKEIGRGVTIKVFRQKQIQAMGMGGLLGVNRGSAKPATFLHLIYKPTKKAPRKIGICGKGITFDSGGLSLKPAKSMENMKEDMAGAATVIAIFKALAVLKPNVEVHGFTPITENMPGGRATKPGDVLRTMRGKTIEVLNTDAEGRLVLADALSYASRQGLDEIIDLATLTGACTIALGNSIAAIMGTDSGLVGRVMEASQISGEKLWELPLEEEYESHMKSSVADIKNIGQAGVAGTIIGGLFLKAFVDEGLPWAHIDIASTAWTDHGNALAPAGGTGVMVRTLLNYIGSYN